MQFLMRYFGKFNFSRKDALQLQHDITNMIMFPIAQHVDQICKHDKTIDKKTKILLELIINFFNNPFEDFDSEYKF